MADPKPRELTLYVESKKAITTFYRPAIPAEARVGTAPISHGETRGADPAGAIGDTGTGVHFLSDDQAGCVALAEEISRRRGYHLSVVDIAKVGRLERLVTEHLKNVQNLPVLIGPAGQRLEGVSAFTEERLCEMMPTDLRSIRAFTYLKIRGGDFDQIRDLLAGLAEVKELHFLTGDWDIFTVLEFPPSTTNKRQVLDFVTERIRGIPEVIDTSTLVPEYSLTKFPLSPSVRAALPRTGA